MTITADLQHRIEQAVYAYQALVDAKDLDGLAGITTDDVELTRQDGTRRGRDEFVGLYRAFAESDVEIAQHTASNVRARELAPGRYGVDSCFVAYTTHGTGEARMVWGRYYDELVDRAGELLLAAKTIRIARVVVLAPEMTFDPTKDSFGKG